MLIGVFDARNIRVLRLDSLWGAKYVARAFPCVAGKAVTAGFVTVSEDKDRASLAELDRKLAAVAGRREEKHGPVSGGRKSSSAGMALGMRISAEMIASTVVGLLIGWGLDRFFNTMPLLLVLFVILGAGAGGLNAYRAAKGYDSAIGLGRAMGKPKQGDKE